MRGGDGRWGGTLLQVDGDDDDDDDSDDDDDDSDDKYHDAHTHFTGHDMSHLNICFGTTTITRTNKMMTKIMRKAGAAQRPVD